VITAPLREFGLVRGFVFRPVPIRLSPREGGQVGNGLIGDTNWDSLDQRAVERPDRLRLIVYLC
jgi:hypothetical protein